MVGASGPSRSQANRQVRQHLDSLKAAGVEYLPFGELSLAPEPAPATAVPPPSPLGGPEISATATVPPKEELTPEQRRQELKVLAERVVGCTRCAELVANRRQTVFGVGPIDVELCFIGEAPGQEEDRRGEPFVGDAGKLLDRIIAACGFKREEVYICNVLKCRPPKNRTPLPNEAANCREYLDRQLDLVRPKFICCLGASAVQNLLGTTVAISRLRGSFQEYRGIPVMCTFHPAYLLRSPEKKKDVWEDMKKLLQRMGRPVPQRSANG
jgi:DNA polymerase